MPDTINCNTTKRYIQIPDSFLQYPDLSGKAKTILGILFSDKEKENTFPCTEGLTCVMKESIGSIKTGLKELEDVGFLRRIRCRDIRTKRFVGSFWAYTGFPNKFDMKYSIECLNSLGYELVEKEAAKIKELYEGGE